MKQAKDGVYEEKREWNPSARDQHAKLFVLFFVLFAECRTLGIDAWTWNQFWLKVLKSRQSSFVIGIDALLLLSLWIDNRRKLLHSIESSPASA